MRNKTLSNIKIYPLNILLEIIVINLLTISGYLRVNEQLALYKETYSGYFAF
mgnify:CR=1 FL=1